MRSLYVAGNTWLHRLKPAIKLATLAVFAAAVFLTRNPVVPGAALVLAGLTYFGLGQPLRSAMRPLLPILLTVAVVALFNLLVNSAEDALLTLLRLSALVLMAAAVTATTGISDFIDTIAAAARPLERAGLVKASDIGLAVGLVIRFVPEILARYQAIREAHAARGLAVRPSTLLGPLIIQTLKDADSIAAAIDARGIRGQ